MQHEYHQPQKKGVKLADLVSSSMLAQQNSIAVLIPILRFRGFFNFMTLALYMLLFCCEAA